MPGLNRKGPDSKGAMTGRSMGHCNPENRGKTDEEILQNREALSQTEQRKGRGRGQGLGRGQGEGKGRGLGRGLGRGKESRHDGNLNI